MAFLSVLVANPKKLLYMVTNPARGLLNRKKKEKKWQRTPPLLPMLLVIKGHILILIGNRRKKKKKNPATLSAIGWCPRDEKARELLV